MYFDEFKHQLPDSDPDQTQEWVDSLEEVVRNQGKERALFPAGTEERVVPGCGHFMPREKPQAVTDALLKVLR